MFGSSPSGEEKKGGLEGTMGVMTASNNVTGSGRVRERERELNCYKVTQLGLLLSHTSTPHCRHRAEMRAFVLFVCLNVCALTSKCMYEDHMSSHVYASAWCLILILETCFCSQSSNNKMSLLLSPTCDVTR